MSNREVYMDHVRQNFWKEMVHKEAILRQDWHLKYSKNFIKSDQDDASQKAAVPKRRRRTGVVPRPNSAVEKMREQVDRDQARLAERQSLFDSMDASGGRRSQGSTTLSKSDPFPTASSPGLQSESSASVSGGIVEPMRAPSAKTRDILYNGLSHDGEGRYKYLTTRKLENVERRYEYPLTYTQEYGWKIRDSMDKYHPSEFGRTAIVRDSFYRHGGVF
ncbi:protein SPMIP1-like [Sycon ciliatum]|uniref:protein SPMIP1-like n=1 Tax=Sycon ciliatum TaxID=27933 RepID=UPI0031F65E09